jgi:ABC-type multidrug transport system ATPase subunit
VSELSVEEHLYLFGRIKGIPSDSLDSVVSAFIEVANLGAYRHRQAGNLSGGNKRKLSLAIALIGNPLTVTLDEPSTGMDPMYAFCFSKGIVLLTFFAISARRYMWKLITAFAQQKALVLTTHSMEECGT